MTTKGPVQPFLVALPRNGVQFDAQRFRKLFHNAGAMEIRTDADLRPRLAVWEEGEELQGLKVWDRTRTHVLRIVSVRVYPPVITGGLPSLFIRYRYNKDELDGRVRIVDDERDAFVKRALSSFGEAVVLAYPAERAPWNFTFWDYNKSRVNDPVAGAVLCRTAIWQERRVTSFEETYGVNPTAVTTIVGKRGVSLAVFGVNNTPNSTLILLDQRLNKIGDATYPGYVFTATAQQKAGGIMLYGAEVDGAVKVYRVAMGGDRRPTEVSVGDVSDAFAIIRCFESFVLLRRGGNVAHLMPLGRNHGEYVQVRIFEVRPDVIPREFHTEGAKLVLDTPTGVKFSSEIQQVGGRVPTLRGGTDPEKTILA